MVTLRTREFAIRMSLGVAPRKLQTDVLWTAFTPVAVGVGVGLLGAFWLATFAESLQDGSQIIRLILRTAPGLAPTALAVGAGALLLSGLACWLPARHAASVDPSVLLKGR